MDNLIETLRPSEERMLEYLLEREKGLIEALKETREGIRRLGIVRNEAVVRFCGMDFPFGPHPTHGGKGAKGYTIRLDGGFVASVDDPQPTGPITARYRGQLNDAGFPVFVVDPVWSEMDLQYLRIRAKRATQCEERIAKLQKMKSRPVKRALRKVGVR